MLSESFIKCSYCAVYVVLAWLTGVSSEEHVTHRKVTAQYHMRVCPYTSVYMGNPIMYEG